MEKVRLRVAQKGEGGGDARVVGGFDMLTSHGFSLLLETGAVNIARSATAAVPHQHVPGRLSAPSRVLAGTRRKGETQTVLRKG